MTEREKIANELELKCAADIMFDGDLIALDPLIVADFIIADRKRILEPLLLPHTVHHGNELEVCRMAIKETINRAGIEEDAQ